MTPDLLRTNRIVAALARPLALVALLAALAAIQPRTAAATAPGTWIRIGDPANPPVFNNPLAVYDSVGDRILAYNPVRPNNGSPVAVAEIWEFRLAEPDSGWRLVPASGPAPLGHVQCSMVVDTPRRRLLLYGGWMPYGGAMSNDVYALALEGAPTWSVIPTTSDTLRVRLDAFLAVDAPRDRLVLHGGSAYFGDHYGVVGDTWAMPLDGPAVWTLAPLATAPPPGRNYAQRAWDAAGSRMLVHGGINATATGALADTWALTVDSAAHWEQLATTGPQVVRVYGGALVDATRDRLLLAPGYGNGLAAPNDERTVYELPLAPGGEWAAAAAADTFDSSAYVMSVAHDSRRDRMVTLSGTFLQSYALADGSGWQRLWPSDPLAAPQAMTGAVLVADPEHARIWQVGGEEASGFAGLWSLDPSAEAQWTHVPLPAALPGAGHAAALDAESHRIVVVGLQYEPYPVATAATEGAPVAQGWTPRDTVPGMRVDHTVVIDPVHRQLVLFGGQLFLAHFSGHSWADVWTLPLDDLTAWTPVTPTGTPPGERGGHFAFWDDLHARMVLFGGWRQGGGPIRHYYGDAWALSFDGTPAWTALDGAAWNPPVQGRVTYDAVHHRLYLFHAGNASSPFETRVYSRGVEDGDAWTLLDAVGDPPLADAPVAFAPWCDRLVVATTNRDGPQADEVYALQLDHAVAALASLEYAEASPERVAIAWRVTGPGPFTLSRRDGDGAWAALAGLLPDGEGRVAYEDRDVSPGRRLTYRLADGVRTLAEHTLVVPARAALAFAGARPSPARGAARMAFSLAADSPVTLELFDVRGARVLARDLGMQSAGEHVWTWAETGTLRPGLYLARLTTRSGVREARLVLLR